MRCGYAFLIEHFHLRLLPLQCPAESSSGVNRLMRSEDRILIPIRMVPAAENVLEHLFFALKHEGIHLAVLSEVLPKVPQDEMQRAVDDSPGGVVVRKLAWLWEEFTGNKLNYVRPAGNYAPFFDSELYFTGPEVRIARWRILYNGLGPLAYCPVVRKTEKLSPETVQATFGRLQAYLESVPSALLQRAAEWAYLSETRSSFEIERETPSGSKAERFIALLKNAGSIENLTEDLLVDIQNRIVSSPYSQAVCYRTTQNWLAHSFGYGFRKVSYVPPPPEFLDELMQGLLSLINSSAGSINALIAAGTASFGFVYLHPFLDGNGRLSRFLIHQQLMHHRAIVLESVLPVSAAMQKHENEYLKALETFSAPCRALWDAVQVDEGDFSFTFKGSAAVYRYWDATAQCEFLLDMIEEAVQSYLQEEIEFLRKYDGIYKAMNGIFDITQNDLDVMIAAALTSGRVSKNIRKKFLYRVPSEAFDMLEALLEKSSGTSEGDGPGLP